MNHAVIIDVVTIIVMCLAVFYAARLNRALMRARDGRSDLAQLITSLTEAHTRAEAAIKSMKATAAEYEASLQKQIAISRGLVDELLLINESSNALANRMERLAPLARGSYEGGYDKPLAPEPLRADRSDRPATTDGKAAWLGEGKKQAAISEKPVAVKARLEAPAERKSASQTVTDTRSRAEQELFAAIETLRKGRQS